MTCSTSATLLAVVALSTVSYSFAQQEPLPPAKPDRPPPPPPSEASPAPPPAPGRDRPPGPPADQATPGRPPSPGREGERRREALPRVERDRGRRDADEGRGEAPGRPGNPENGFTYRSPERDRPAEPPKKPTPYLGVVTGAPPPALVAQLALADGFGLLVEEVLPDSPAKAAGVQRYDVLKQLNDQQLAEPGQLAALVRSLGKGADATLTIIRKGQEQKLSIKVGEKLLPEYLPRADRPSGADNAFGGARRQPLELFRSYRDAAPRGQSPAQGQGQGGSTGPSSSPERMRAARDWMRNYQQDLRRYEERLREWQKKPDGEMPKLPPVPEPPFGEGRSDSPDEGRPAGGGSGGIRPADLLRELRPGAPADVRAEWGGGASQWDASRARMVMHDRDGEVVVAVKDGHRVLTAKGPNGEDIFTGPVDTPEQRQAVPQPFRGKLETLEIRQSQPGQTR
jgi:hypothetical protein